MPKEQWDASEVRLPCQMALEVEKRQTAGRICCRRGKMQTELSPVEERHNRAAAFLIDNRQSRMGGVLPVSNMRVLLEIMPEDVRV